MERSQWPKRLSKLGYTDNRSQRGRVRFSDIEQVMENEDYFEADIRHTGSRSSIRANERERTQLGKLRKEFKHTQGRLSKDLGVDE